MRVHDDNTCDTYNVLGILGHGGFGTVYKVRKQEDNQLYALKATSLDDIATPKMRKKYDNELTIQRGLNHKNIVSSYDNFEDDFNSYIILELCPNNSVKSLISRRGKLSEKETAEILLNVIEGLEYMHGKGIIHRDIKPENFLIGPKGDIKIADLGLSVDINNDDNEITSCCGTVDYMAPEVACKSGKPYSFPVDVWAIGVSAYTMLVGHPPFEGRDNKSTFDRICSVKYLIPSENKLSFAASDFITSILQAKPENRPKLSYLKKHPFMKQIQKNRTSLPPLQIPAPKPIIGQQRRRVEFQLPDINSGRNENANKNNQSKSLPSYCVSRYSSHEKYGLGYLLINGTVGAIFNDNTRIVTDPNEEFIQYWPNYNVKTPEIVTINENPELTKKIQIMKKYIKAMKKASLIESDNLKYSPNIPLVHVKFWTQNSENILFRFSNRNLQTNFNDKTKMVIFTNSKQLMTVQSIKELATPIPIRELPNDKYLKNIHEKYEMTKVMINNLELEMNT